MKLMNHPKPRYLFLASFLFLLLQFGLTTKLEKAQFDVNSLIKLQTSNTDKYSSQSGEDQQEGIHVPRSIPDTYSAEIFQAQRELPLEEPVLPEPFSQDGGVAMDGSASQAIAGAVVDPSGAQALYTTRDVGFEAFVLDVANGDSETITGVYVAGLLSLRVLQQPPEDVAFVSNENGTATQFQSSAHFGVVGLLAHNYLSGRHFLSIAPGHEIRLVYGDGSYRRYQVVGLADFERLTRFDVLSDFRDLQTQAILTSREVFDRFYRGNNYLTLQTCLEGDGDLNWGIRMVSAVPIDPDS
jgi:hypothetical protein